MARDCGRKHHPFLSHPSFSGLNAEERFAGFLRQEPITAAWIFGSHARNEAGPLSDVDVGILPAAHLQADARFGLIGRVASAAQDLFGTRHADVVLVDEAPPHLAFAAISGRLLIETDHERRWLTEARIMSEYHDRRHADERWQALTRERYGRGEFA